MTTLHHEIVDNFTLTIHPDETPENPRDWDNLGTMICWHRRYTLGDSHSFAGVADWLISLLSEDTLKRKAKQFGYGDVFADIDIHSFADTHHQTLIEEAAKQYLIVPVYLYDHSGLALRCYPFHCRWDSGQVGFIHVSHRRLRQEYGVKRLSSQVQFKAKKVLELEVETCSQWVNGEIYGYQIENSAGDIVDSCWGFYGEEEALNAGRESLSFLEGRQS